MPANEELRPAMKRRLFNLVAGASLLILLIMLTLWVRSFWKYDLVAIRHAPTAQHPIHLGAEIVSHKGLIQLKLFCSTWDRVAPQIEDYARSTPFTLQSEPASRYESFVWIGFDINVKMFRRKYPYPPGPGTSVGGRLLRPRLIQTATASEPAIVERYWGVMAPHWATGLPAGVLPLIWLRRKRQQRMRIRCGLCLACGYNLIGNVSGICPECGTAIPASQPLADNARLKDATERT